MADPGFGKEGFQVTVEAGEARIQTAEGGGREAAHPRGVWGHAPPENFGNMHALRRVLVHSGGNF